MNNIEKLKKLYNNDLKPQLVEIENQRKSIKKLFISALGVLISLIFVLPFMTQIQALLFAVIIIGLLSILFLAGIAAIKFFTYRNQFKTEVVSKIVTLINPAYHYDADRHISSSYLETSKLFKKTPDRCFGDDFISGRIDKTNFEFSELKAAIRHVTTENGKSSESWEPIFEGLFFHADFNKHLLGNTFVLPDKSEKFLGKFGQSLQKGNNQGQLVKLENQEFEKEYKVISSSQQEARYILTPAIMEAMVRIKKQFKKNLYVSFTGERIYCAIENPQGLFEPRIFKSGINFNDMAQMYFLFGFIETIITELNLNTRIWTKD